MSPEAPIVNSTALRFFLILLAAHSLALPAQILHATAPLPSFEVATIKPRDTSTVLRINPPGSEDIFRSVGTALNLIAQAYNLPSTSTGRIDGGPPWANNDWYVIQATIPAELFTRMQKMTFAERREETNLMMQSLLADRFQVKVHFETREMQVYELVVAKDGPKLPLPNSPPAPSAAAEPNKPPPDMRGSVQMSQGTVKARNVTLDGMLQAPFFGLGGRPIMNKTGLTGTYNLTLGWTPEQPTASNSNGAAAPDDSGVSIFTALQEQLGLKLVPAKAPVEIIVIDHIEKPSEN
jgi:bla regulator protein BlaR1